LALVVRVVGATSNRALFAAMKVLFMQVMFHAWREKSVDTVACKVSRAQTTNELVRFGR
jgi:hypothetical protein